MIILVGHHNHDDDDDRDTYEDYGDDDDDCLSPRELEGSREVRKSEEEVFSPAENDFQHHSYCQLLSSKPS